MATRKDYRDYIIDNLSLLGDITYKPMMGEYLLYYKGILFGGIYDDRLLIKKVDGNKKYKLDEAIPYPGGKPMYIVFNTDDKELLRDIVEDTYRELKR